MVNLECVKDIVINCDVLEMFPQYTDSQFLLGRARFLCFLARSTGSEEQKETACSLILPVIEIHASVIDYFHGLASFGVELNICC